MRIKENVKEGGLYAAPEISVVEIYAEGVLCQSGQFEQWNEESLEW